MRPPGSVLVLGAGVFGLTAAIELAARGWSVEVDEPGPFPHPDAASNDVSKIVRTDYGTDVFYTELAERALEGWERWNQQWGWDAFQRTGFLLLAAGPLEPGSFEHASFVTAVQRGHAVERLDPAAARSGGTCWSEAAYADGYVNRGGGWSPSGRVIEELALRARSMGVTLRVGRRAVAIERRADEPLVRFAGESAPRPADVVVVATGSWTPTLLPELADRVWAVGQPVFHLLVEQPEAWVPPAFLPWAADIAGSGWYGFPALPDGRLKVANHGPGTPLHPDAERVVSSRDEARLRQFLERALPKVADAPIVTRRLCVYTETFDNDFFIDRHPDRPGVVVATGGSGHAYKFGPVLGELIADAVETRENRWLRRFRWRPAGERRVEPARYLGD
ncbi:MAG: FAD-dependent oxidoreductase [Gemmatimonadota bacterium]